MTLTSTQLFSLAFSTAAREIVEKFNQAAQEFPVVAHEITTNVQTEATQGLKTVSDWTHSAREWAATHQRNVVLFHPLILAGLIATIVGTGIMLITLATSSIAPLIVGYCIAAPGFCTFLGATLHLGMRADDSRKISRNSFF